MVTLLENQIIITISTPTPAETLAEIQSGIIEMIKTILSSGGEDKDLELDRPTANWGYFILDLLSRESGFDPATVEAVQSMAAPIQSCRKDAVRDFGGRDGEIHASEANQVWENASRNIRRGTKW